MQPRSTLERLEERRLLSTYTLIDLAALGLPGRPVDLNDAGQLAGFAAGRAFRWSDGTVTDLGNLGGPVTAVTDMNNLGHVIGASSTAPGAAPVPFLWKDGVMTDLGLGPGATVVAINDSGQIVGNANGRAFLWENGTATDLGELVAGAGASAADINNAGQVIGTAYSGAAGSLGLPVNYAFRWQDSVMTSLGTAPFTDGSHPGAINEAGQFVGSTTVFVNTGYGAAFVSKSMFYDGTAMTTLPVPTLQNVATDINDAGLIVGTMNGRAYVYEGGVVKDLNALVPPGQRVLTAASAVNNSGLIIGLRSDGSSFLIRPDPPAPPGPEVQVWAGGQEVADETGSVAFGQTPVGVTVTRAFSVRNVGSETLSLTGPITVPAGLTLVSGFSATSLAPAGVATFIVRLDAAGVGAPAGQISFGTNDVDEATFNFAVSGEVVTGRVIDDGSPGFSISGARATISSQGYQGDSRRIPPANRLLGSRRVVSSARFRSTAAWSFGVLDAGAYRVSATWTPGADRATNAPFTVLSGVTPLVTRSINQRLAPDDLSAHGAAWEDLGTFTIGRAPLTVRLSNQANGWVIADAVRIERVEPSASIAVPGTFGGATSGAITTRLSVRRATEVLVTD